MTQPFGPPPGPPTPYYDAGAVMGAALLAAQANLSLFSSFPASWAAAAMISAMPPVPPIALPASWGAALALGQAFTAAATAYGGPINPTSSSAATVPLQPGRAYLAGQYVAINTFAWVCSRPGTAAGTLGAPPTLPPVSLDSAQLGSSPPLGAILTPGVLTFTCAALVPFSEIWAAAPASAAYDLLTLPFWPYTPT